MATYELQALICGEHPWTWTSLDGTETFEYSPTRSVKFLLTTPESCLRNFSLIALTT
jgi:hypothetical protein